MLNGLDANILQYAVPSALLANCALLMQSLCGSENSNSISSCSSSGPPSSRKSCKIPYNYRSRYSFWSLQNPCIPDHAPAADLDCLLSSARVKAHYPPECRLSLLHCLNHAAIKPCLI